MSVVDALLKLKRFRESQAQTALMRERLRFARARTDEDAAKAGCDTYRAFAQKKEETLFGGLIGRPVRVRAIEDVRGQVAVMANENVRLESVFDVAKQQVKTVQGEMDDAQRTLRRAEQVTGKFVELVRIHADAHFLQTVRREDLEMEEVASQARRRDEWQAAGDEGDGGDDGDGGRSGANA